ncbi:AsnC family transcriptional regulator [Candidatus Woesearchaeota archaeon]|nr:AsnC family transcriptional regulator [Candidatus Woesearchaeota archaeon]
MSEIIKIDAKDRHLLFELDRNSRQSIHDLARKTKLNRDVVAYRMKRLEKAGIIQDYITIIDFTKFDYQISRIYLQLQKTTPEIEQRMVQMLVEEKSVFTVYKIDGNYQLAMGFLFKDLRQFNFFWQKFLEVFKPYIAEQNISPFIDYFHFNRNYLVEKSLRDEKPLSVASFKSYAYHSEDILLLHIIKENSRITLLELAKKLHMTPAGVRYKLRNLEKNKVIVAYKLLLDSAKLGYNYYKIDLELEDLKIIPALHEFISRNPNVIYRDVALSCSDFEFDVELRNQDMLYALIEKIKSLFPGKIRRWYYYKTLKIYKYSYLPGEII